MIPPKAFIPILRRASPTALERDGPVAAATNVTTTAPNAAVAGCNGPSEFGLESAVGVVSIVETRASVIGVGPLAPASPLISTSRTSVVCVEDPPFIAIYVLLARAEPSATVPGVQFCAKNERLAILVP